MSIQTVLVVEDETMFREFLVGWLRKEGFEVVGEGRTLADAERVPGMTPAAMAILAGRLARRGGAG